MISIIVLSTILGVFYKNQNRIKDSNEILNSLKNCGCEEYENLKMQIN